MAETDAFFLGLTVMGGLITGFGPQNCFVLRQGLGAGRSWAVPAISSACDIALTATGVVVVGSGLNAAGIDPRYAALCGAGFLIWHSICAVRRLLRRSMCAPAADYEVVHPSISALGFSLLNPYVYIDTVMLIGPTGAALPGNLQPSFIAGCGTASVAWFFGLTALAGVVAPRAGSSGVQVVVEIFMIVLCAAGAIKLLGIAL